MCALTVNETKITTKNALHRDNFVTKANVNQIMIKIHDFSILQTLNPLSLGRKIGIYTFFKHFLSFQAFKPLSRSIRPKVFL